MNDRRQEELTKSNQIKPVLGTADYSVVPQIGKFLNSKITFYGGIYEIGGNKFRTNNSYSRK